ncbi:hypothetical protein LQZ18_03090 [Lachnospiraceae bacterium ZAX-1]
MKLIKFEMIKLAKSPAILGFFSVCLLFNVIVVFASSHKTQIDYLNGIAKITGVVYGEEYKQKLQTVKKPADGGYPYDWLYESLEAAAEGAHNAFADWDNQTIQNRLKSSDVKLSDTAKKMLAWKYDKLEPIVAEKAMRGDGKSVYFATQSYHIHETVFGNIGKILAVESCIFFVLIMLWALGFESIAGTSLVTYSTKAGRKLAIPKIVAALLIGMAFFITTYIITYGLTFGANDFSVVWGQNVSAQYLEVSPPFLGRMPFATWEPMTVGGYFWVGVGVAFLNGLVSALFAVPFGLLIKNTYVAFCCVSGLSFVNFVVMLMGSKTAGTVPFLWHLSLIAPLPQIFNNLLWFTDGGTGMLLPHFEVLYPLIFAALLVPAIAFSAKKFIRKEIA